MSLLLRIFGEMMKSSLLYVSACLGWHKWPSSLCHFILPSQEHSRPKGERDPCRAAGIHGTLHSVSGSGSQATCNLQLRTHSCDFRSEKSAKLYEVL